MRSTSSIPHAALATSGIFAPSASPSSAASLSAMSLTERFAGEGAALEVDATPRAGEGAGELEVEARAGFVFCSARCLRLAPARCLLGAAAGGSPVLAP